MNDCHNRTKEFLCFPIKLDNFKAKQDKICYTSKKAKQSILRETKRLIREKNLKFFSKKSIKN